MSRRFLELQHPAGGRALVLPTGARLVSLRAPVAGRLVESVLGHDDPAAYDDDRAFLGATVGRVANRIGDARFPLGDEVVQVSANHGAHHLHGGDVGGFHAVEWEVVAEEPGRVVLQHVSRAGTEGYPGTVTARVAYALAADGLAITMTATTDAVTPVALTNHAYWHLGPPGADVLGHDLTVHAEHVAAVDGDLVPTGERAAVAGTPLDLRDARRLGDVVRERADEAVRGLDHAYLLDGPAGTLREVAVLRDPGSGVTLSLSSDQVSLQVFTANGMALPARDGTVVAAYGAVCLEPQAVPNAVNLPGFPSVLLHPGQEYRNELVVRFSST